jgi:hypothetical protein
MPIQKVLILSYAYVWAGIGVHPKKSISGLMYADSQNVNILVTNPYNNCLKNNGLLG